MNIAEYAKINIEDESNQNNEKQSGHPTEIDERSSRGKPSRMEMRSSVDKKMSKFQEKVLFITHLMHRQHESKTF